MPRLLVLLLALLIPGVATAQTISRTDPDDSLNYEHTTRQITPFVVDPAVLAAHFAYDLDCAGLDSSRLRPVKFFYRSPTVYMTGTQTHNFILGEWVRPDTIFIDPKILQASNPKLIEWVFRHELLHHLLNLDVGMNPHPPAMFIGCKLFDVQRPDGTVPE